MEVGESGYSDQGIIEEVVELRNGMSLSVRTDPERLKRDVYLEAQNKMGSLDYSWEAWINGLKFFANPDECLHDAQFAGHVSVLADQIEQLPKFGEELSAIVRERLLRKSLLGLAILDPINPIIFLNFPLITERIKGDSGTSEEIEARVRTLISEAWSHEREHVISYLQEDIREKNLDKKERLAKLASGAVAASVYSYIGLSILLNVWQIPLDEECFTSYFVNSITLI